MRRPALTLLLGVILGLAGLAGIVSSSAGVSVLILATLVCIVSLATVWLRYRRHGLNDPLLIFAFFLALYNGLPLLEFAWRYPGSLETYPIQFNPETYLKAAFASLLAALGLLLSAVVAVRVPRKGQAAIAECSTPPIWLGVGVFCLGLVLLFLDFRRIGGFAYALSIPRVVRLNLLSELRGSLPYAPFAFVGLALTWLSYTSQQRGKLWAYGLLVVWVGLMLVQGDRRFLTYSILIAFGVTAGIRYPRILLNPRLVGGTALALVLFLSFGQVRWVLPSVLTGQMSPGDALEWVVRNASRDWLLPSANEFAGPYFTLLYSIEYSYPSVSPLLGRSYLQAIPNLLPRSLYPGEKPSDLSREFDVLIHEQYMPAQRGVVGWGYSPVAEAYNNFGLWGVPAPFFLFGLLWEWVKRASCNTWVAVVAYALLLPQALNVNRTTVAWAFQEAVYSLGALWLVLSVRAIFVARKVSRLGRKAA